MSKPLIPPVKTYGLVMRSGQQLLTLEVAFKRPLSQAARLRIQTKLLGLGRKRGDALGVSFGNNNGIEISLPVAEEMLEENIFLAVLDTLGVRHAAPNLPIRWADQGEPSNPNEKRLPIPDPPARLH